MSIKAVHLSPNCSYAIDLGSPIPLLRLALTGSSSLSPAQVKTSLDESLHVASAQRTMDVDERVAVEQVREPQISTQAEKIDIDRGAEGVISVTGSMPPESWEFSRGEGWVRSPAEGAARLTLSRDIRARVTSGQRYASPHERDEGEGLGYECAGGDACGCPFTCRR
jgi:hypothetical protein